AVGRPTIVITHDAHLGERVLMLAHDPDGETRFSFPSVEALAEFLNSVSVSEVIYNNLVGSTDPLKMIRVLRMQIAARSLPLTFMVHDFYPLCPSYTLINKDGSYCGVPADLAICAACIQGYSKDLLPYGPTRVGIHEWRSEWRELMELATEIRCFSTSSLDIFMRAYPDFANKCTVIPHQVEFKPSRLPTIRPASHLHIGVVGGINYSKGRAVLQSLVRHIEDHGLDHKVSVVGQVDVPIRGITVTGKYEVTHLPEIIEKLGINVILIPSIWPETFSYVTSEMMLLGMPVACFNIGAPAERIKNYEKGIVLGGSDPETILKGLLQLCSAERSHEYGLTV
ncbi:MAG TPA: glycosyltransferase, partial [Steroidobacteraceae bacterium]|nr:glycosyltransferase [Steroidobacteraceae bacterium]